MQLPRKGNYSLLRSNPTQILISLSMKKFIRRLVVKWLQIEMLEPKKTINLGRPSQ